MRRTPLVLLTWVLGTAGSVAVGSLGVQLVTSAVTPPRVSPLTRPEVVAALSVEAAASKDIVSALTNVPTDGGAPAPAPVAPPTPAPQPIPHPSRSGDATPVAPAVTPSRRGEKAVQWDSEGRGQNPPSASASSQIKPQSVEATATRSTASSTQSAKGQGTVRTIQSWGGVVAVRFEGDRTTLAWARPNAGYQVVVNSKGNDWVDVVFRSGDHGSRIVAWIGRDGSPVQKVREFTVKSDGGHKEGHGHSDN